MLVRLAVVAAGVARSTPAADKSGEPMTVGPIDADRRERLLRFRVPGVSRDSVETPVRIAAQVVRQESQPPYILEAYLLVPLEPAGTAGVERSAAPIYRRVPFGRMDVFAPLAAGSRFDLFPADAAVGARAHVRPGDDILVGIDALAAFPEDAPPNVSVKVRDVVDW